MSLKTGLHCLPMKERLKRLLYTPTFHDCSFIFVNDGNQVLHANKLILSTVSSVFEAMFFGLMANDEPIKIDDIQPSIFKHMLHFIYTDKCVLHIPSPAIYNLYYAAEKYMLSSLKKLCLMYMKSKLDVSNALSIYEHAEFFKINELITMAKTIIKENTSKVLKTNDFLNIRLSTLNMILDQELLHISSEWDLFDAVISWGRKESERRGLISDNDTLRSVIDVPLKKIRFLTFSVEDFREGPAESQILTDVESYLIFMNLVPGPSTYALPEGFSVIEYCRGDEYLKWRRTYNRPWAKPISRSLTKGKNEYEDYEEPLELGVLIKHLMHSQKFTDCSFVVCEDGDFSPRKYNAHKLILSIASPVFHKMLASNDGDIELEDIKPDCLERLLDYMYMDQCDIRDGKTLHEMWAAAVKFNMPWLLEKIFEIIIPVLTAKNAFQTYEKALLYSNLAQDHRIFSRCLEVIDKSDAGFMHPNFELIQLTTLLKILCDSQRDLQLSKTELFEAVIRWARKECKRRGLQEDSDNLRAVAEPALKEIDFLAFSAEEFAKGPGESQILTQDESHRILMNIVNKSSGISMPDGFSTERERKKLAIVASKRTSKTTSSCTKLRKPIKRYITNVKQYGRRCYHDDESSSDSSD